MSMIKIEHLSFGYSSGAEKIFDDMNIILDSDWRIGLIGRNGKGKTTLLRLLMEEYEYSGKISKTTACSYFPYQISNQHQTTLHILQELCPNCEEWEFQRELSLLKLSDNMLARSFNTLSGGEKTKILLAALFLNQQGFLLIDEPTNHLDAEGRVVLASYLKRKRGFLLVSHDRTFLDMCIDHVLAINRSDITIQSGNFSSWMIDFEQQQENEANKSVQLKKEIKQLHTAAQRNATWSNRIEASKFHSGPVDRGFIGHKAAKMMKRSKAVENRRQQAINEKTALLKNQETIEALVLKPLKYHSHTLAYFQNLILSYENKAINQPLSFTINQGDHIIIDGKNGSGKSTLLKLLNKENITYSGTASIPDQLIRSYVPQDCSFLCGKLTAFSRLHHIDESLFKAILRKLDFSRQQFDQDMSRFSDGQKKKVMIAKSLCESAHLYIWDEPLNYIDIYTRMQIEEMIKSFQGTMILVEHDRYFQNEVATKTIYL